MMGNVILHDLEPSEPPPCLPNKGNGHASRVNALMPFLRKLGRRVHPVWITRVVEGVLLKHQMQKFYLIMGGHIYFQTLSAAVQFDLFGLLKTRGRLTCSQIAGCLNIEEKPTRILLLGCTALGLLRKSGPLYANSRLAERLLVRDAPGNIVSVIEWQHHINYRPMHRFYDALKANKNIGLDEFEGEECTLYERLVHYPKLEKIFQDAMEGISIQANAMLARFVDFSDVGHVVDVGGGNGANLIGLAQRYPHLKATVFDSPTVCRMAEANFRTAGLSDRLSAVAGDCFKDDFPHGADCLLFAHFFTIWSEQQNRAILKRCHQALPAGGKVIIFNMMQRNDGRGPLSAAMGSPYFLTLATGQGMLYTWREYESWMKEAGFKRVKKHRLPRDHGVIIGTKV